MTVFRRIAIAEATSFLALLVASYVKHNDGGDLGVSILGPIHGGLFLVYVWLALTLRPRVGWSLQTTLLILLGAVLPFGGYAVDVWLRRQPVPQGQ